MIGAQDIKNLRERTGFSFAQCKKALEEAGGSLEKAMESLKVQGIAIMEKKSDREQHAGVVSSYVHATGAVGAIIVLSCETDFVSKNPDFKILAHDIAMHATALAPADVPALLLQPFIKDASKTVGDLLRDAVQKFGENISVTALVRLAV